jgi:cytochrome P450
MIVVSDTDLAAALLDDERANYKGASYILTRAVLDNVLLLNGEAWRTHRKAYRLALRDVDVKGVAKACVDGFVRDLAQAGARGASVPLDRAVSDLVRDLVGGFVLGAQLPASFEADRARIQYELAGLGIDLQCQPWKYLSPMRWVRLRRAVAAARTLFREHVERRLARPDPDARDVLAGFMRLARAGEYPSDVSALVDGAVNFFFTAHDVLTSSASFCLHLLASHPDEATKLRAETASRPDGDGDLDFDGRPRLDAVVRESLRLYPGYALFGRTLQADVVVGGYRVPRGTLAIVSPFVTHRLERNFDDAARFVPDRWRSRGPTSLAPSASHGYLPFGSGARGCLASHLAVPILKTIASRTTRALDLRAVPGHVPRLAYWGSAYSENGLPVTVARAAPQSSVEPRDAAHAAEPLGSSRGGSSAPTAS